jgi:hypothetical protein
MTICYKVINFVAVVTLVGYNNRVSFICFHNLCIILFQFVSDLFDQSSCNGSLSVLLWNASIKFVYIFCYLQLNVILV